MSQFPATKVTCSVQVGAVVVQLKSDVAQSGVDSGNYSLSLLRNASHLENAEKKNSSCERSLFLNGS